jgi:phosphatidate cytidylyltransferase
MISNQLKQRLIFGLTGTTLLFLSIYFSNSVIFKPIFVLLTAGIIAGSLWEYYRLTIHKGFSPPVTAGIASTILYITSFYIVQLNPSWHALPAFILFLTLPLFFFLFFDSQPDPLVNLAITVFGIVYLTIPLSFGLKINYFEFGNSHDDGRLWLVYAFFITKITDTGAYFFGKTFGKHKLLPHISPKKTIEGSVGGIFAAVISSLLFYAYFSLNQTTPLFTITLAESLWIGLAVSLLAQFGDLAESILKRDAGVKDSSHLPGLGGLLDIVDSLVFTLPFIYFILKMKYVG